MKKIFNVISLILSVALITAFLTSCNLKLTGEDYAKDLDYYNKKAVDNIDSLIGKSTPNEFKTWIFKTYSSLEVTQTKLNKDIIGKSYGSYISKDKSVLIDFIKDEEDSSIGLYIHPNIYLANSPYSSDPNLPLLKFTDASYINKVDDFSRLQNPDYREAPMIAKLAVENISEPSKLSLSYSYPITKDGEWLNDTGDELPTTIEFLYQDNSFVYSLNAIPQN